LILAANHRQTLAAKTASSSPAIELATPPGNCVRSLVLLGVLRHRDTLRRSLASNSRHSSLSHGSTSAVIDPQTQDRRAPRAGALHPGLPRFLSTAKAGSCVLRSLFLPASRRRSNSIFRSLHQESKPKCRRDFILPMVLASSRSELHGWRRRPSRLGSLRCSPSHFHRSSICRDLCLA
jgi:hypothetical protein